MGEDRSSYSGSPSFPEVLEARLTRRDILKTAAATGATIALGAGFVGSVFESKAVAKGSISSLEFTELQRVYDQTHHIAPGYRADVLIRWGDKLFADAPDFDASKQSVESQSRQFGYDNDYIGYLPLPKGSNSSDHGLLCVNNEYPNPHVMFPGLVVSDPDAGKKMSKEHVDVCLASMGLSIVEVRKTDGKWAPVENSPYNRRITGFTEMAISGPAAGHALMKTKSDPSGTKSIGTGANCSGGITLWGTILSCEEFNYTHFGGDPAKTEHAAQFARDGMMNEDYYGFARYYDQYNVEKERQEFHRWQWVVEIDPFDTASMPIKRTALGRMGHEGANLVVNKDGRVTIYMGDDDYFEYIYRFVSKGTFTPGDAQANRKLLDEGVLSVAKFEADGALKWLPLVHGQGPLTAQNGFADQGEVLIRTRKAGDAVGATPMDRPEDIERNPISGRIYVALTKNSKRAAENVNPVNTRPANDYGHIVELIPPGEGADADHSADSYRWDILVLCGDPSKQEHGAKFHPETSSNGWFVTPDNLGFDPKGRLWVGTDGQNDFNLADGLFGVDTTGPARGLPKAFFCAPSGAEVTGPAFTPDGKTLFLSVQHPAENSETIEKLTTRWPDFNEAIPPRPSVVAITREDGGEIGG
jgi:uncharacterized protein